MNPPCVFISYSHDSPEHRDRVLALTDRLRADGINAMIDLYVQYPPEGWPAWLEAEISKADFVVMVCSENYLRRFNREDERGTRLGTLWEAEQIRQHLNNAGSASRKFVPVLLGDGSPANIPWPLRGTNIYRVETPEGYEALLRLVTDQPLMPMPPLGPHMELPPRQRGAAWATEAHSKLAASLAHPQVEDVFVGRHAERAALAAAVFPTSGARRPAVVSGMAGVGKSYLVDRFFWENAERFPGGYVRLALDPSNPASVEDLLTALRDRLKLPAGDDRMLVARLLMPLTLIHIENADNLDASHAVGEMAAALPGCALVVSARFRDLGFGAGWPEVLVAPFDKLTALEQLQAELGPDAKGQESWPALVAALGFLPLALHLAAGHLRADHRADAFLRRLRAKNLALTGADPADPSFRERSRKLSSDTFELSLGALRREGGADGEQWLAAFSALGDAPSTGFGESLGAAVSGLSAEAFEDMVLAASRLSLLDRVPRGSGSAYRLHPLLAEFVRSRADREAAFARMTEWFVARLPAGGEDQGQRWREVHEEIAALIEWLTQLPAQDRARVERAGKDYAFSNGPFHTWLRFCEEALIGESSEVDRSNYLWTLGQVALRGGLPDRALGAAQEQRTLDLRRGAERDAAMASGLIADIMQACGQLDEALKIRNEEELPVYQRLGDVRSRAMTMGKIADILQARGQFDEALKIHNEEELPVYERLGDVRSRAWTMGQIADILQARGQLDEALKIRNEEQLPVYERLGDVRSRAVTMGQIADILQARGQFDEALKIRNEEELPIYERLGDVRSRAVTMGKIADILQARGQLDEALKILNEEVLPAMEPLGDVRSRAVTMGRIADILQARGQLDEALRLRMEEAPIYEQLGAARDLLVARTEQAMTRLLRGGDGDREEARRLLSLARDEALRLKLPEARQIEEIIAQAGPDGD
jgi:tetratricopeptide (TPR) repeat protein